MANLELNEGPLRIEMNKFLFLGDSPLRHDLLRGFKQKESKIGYRSHREFIEIKINC
jgi:hypothetical protein